MRFGVRANTASIRSRNCERRGQRFQVIRTFVATQLKETLLTTEAATFSAWNASCRREYSPGRKIQGLTLPNSLVTGFSSTGVFADFRLSLSAPGGPQTIQS